DGKYIYNYTWGLGSASGTNSAGSPLPNPAAASILNINKNVSYRGLTNVFLKIDFLKYFSFSSNVGVNFLLTEAKEKRHPLFASADLDLGVGEIYGRDIRSGNIINTNLLRYDRTFNEKHNLGIVVGHEAQVLTNKNAFVIRRDIAGSPIVDQPIIGTLIDAGSIATEQQLLSYFGQANYNFDNKYLLSASLRTDGSSLFGDNRRFGSHWSAGAGWVVSAEPFMESVNRRVDYLKIRGSLGSAGNSSAILNSLRYDQVLLYNYRDNPAIIPNMGLPPGNPDIQWEKTFTWDAGLELRVLDNRLSLTADIYSKKTSQLIGRTEIPTATGFTSLTDNIGDLSNKGIELSIAANMIRTRDFSWNISANWSKNQNRLVRSFYPIENVTGSVIVNGKGENYNSYYLPRWAGVNPQNGKPQWYDSTGKISSDYYAAKSDFVGKPQPDGFGAVTNSFSFRGFELSAMIYYQYGAEIYSYDASSIFTNDGNNPYLNQSKSALNRWRRPGDIAVNPRRLLFGSYESNSDMGTNPSTRFMYNGDFIRLSNVALAYNFQPGILEKLHMSTLRIFLQGHNLATWTNYVGQDPESVTAEGLGTSGYPLQRSYTLGLTANF
ncbi:MAG: TonB-dependent receptor, partial [Pedobacter agri]